MLWIIAIVLIVAFALGVIAEIRNRYTSVGSPVALISGLLIFIIGITWISNYMAACGDIAQFESVRSSIEAARTRGETLENAALQQKVVDSNRWLAGAQYWADNWFAAAAWPDRILELEPIE